VSLVPPTIIRELKLKDFGYKVTAFGPYYQAYPDGRAIKVWPSDYKRSYPYIARFSKKDADTLPEWEAWLKGVADILGPMLLQVPPRMGSLSAGDLLEQARAAWKVRKLGVRGVADVPCSR
jgi:phytoene dehydrogenase-like protein